MNHSLRPSCVNVLCVALACACVVSCIWGDVWSVGSSKGVVVPFRKLDSNEDKNVAKSASKDVDAASYAVAAHLTTQMPFYLNIMAYYMKTIITVLALGIDKIDKPKSCLGATVLWITFAGVALSLVMDCREASKLLTRAGLTWWEKWNGVVLVFATSSNIMTSASFFGLVSLFTETAKWNKIHNLPHTDEWKMARKALPGGLFGVFFFCFAMCFCVNIPILLYVTPALIAYCWLSFPFWSVVMFAGSFCMPGAIKLITESKASEASQEQGSAGYQLAADKELISTGYQLALAADYRTFTNEVISEDDYTKELAYFKTTGVPFMGWYRNFTFPPVLGLAVPLFTSMAVRLYTGRGYMSSVTETLGERHILVWANYMADSAINTAGTLQSVTPNSVDSVLILAQRWLTALTYWI